PFVNVVFLVPALLIALFDFQSFFWVAVVFGIYGGGQALDPILTPYLLSRGTGLHPVTIIVSIFVWGRLLGATGLLLAVPLSAALKIIGRETVVPILAGGESEADPTTTGTADERR
ncbi:MAG: AI-2E family transporter, partial [Planctomycetota bacterium]